MSCFGRPPRVACRRMLLQGEDAIEPERMALLAQRCWRGYISRKKTQQMRAEELVFIGSARAAEKPHNAHCAPLRLRRSHPTGPTVMPPEPKKVEEDPKVKEAEIKERRKLIQAQHEQEYRDSLVQQKTVG